MTLKADYKDDMFAGDRRYRMIQNTDGTVKIEDVTIYTQNGDKFGANDINATNNAINNITTTKGFVILASKWSSTVPYIQEISIEGVTVYSTPVISLNIKDHLDNAAYVKNMKKQCSHIDYIETLEGKIKAYCLNKKPDIDIYCILKGV